MTSGTNSKYKSFVKEIIVHEKYSNEAYGVEYNDLAILKLETPLVFDRRVQPACLPDPSTSSENIEDMAVVSGWGKTRESKLSTYTIKNLISRY